MTVNDVYLSQFVFVVHFQSDVVINTKIAQ